MPLPGSVWPDRRPARPISPSARKLHRAQSGLSGAARRPFGSTCRPALDPAPPQDRQEEPCRNKCVRPEKVHIAPSNTKYLYHNCLVSLRRHVEKKAGNKALVCMTDTYDSSFAATDGVVNMSSATGSVTFATEPASSGRVALAERQQSSAQRRAAPLHAR
jgi:hypothetical protein